MLVDSGLSAILLFRWKVPRCRIENGHAFKSPEVLSGTHFLMMAELLSSIHYHY
jgi:hypothetical protein